MTIDDEYAEVSPGDYCDDCNEPVASDGACYCDDEDADEGKQP